MARRVTSFNPSTNLIGDLDNKTLVSAIIVTNQIRNAVKLYFEDDSNTGAVSIVGPYGSGKSTTTLFLYHYLCNSLPKKLKSTLSSQNISSLDSPYKHNDIRVLVGQKLSLQKSLCKTFSIRSDIVGHIKENYISKNKRLIVIIDEFGKYLEYASDNPKDGDVYILQELAELATRSNDIFKLITVRHQSILGYFSGLKGSYLNEWKKIQGRFHEIVHSNTIEDTITLIKPFIDATDEVSYTPSKIILDYIKNNEAIGQVSQNSTFTKPYPFHPFSVLIIVSAYKRFAQNERSVFSFLNTNDRYGIKNFITKTENIYRISDFYDYIKYNLEHHIIESPYYQDWNKIEVALRDLKKTKNEHLGKYFDFSKHLIKTIGMLDLFGGDVDLSASKNILSAALLDISNKKNTTVINKCIRGLEEENIITYNKFYGGAYHLWHGAQVNINELIADTIQEQRGSVNIAKHLERLAPNDPLVAKKHLIRTGTFRSIELRYASITEFPEERVVSTDAIIYIFIAKNDYQRRKIESQIPGLNLDSSEKPLIFVLNDTLENQVREYIAISYLEMNNEQLKTDNIGREELSNIKYQSSLVIESMIKNHKINGAKLYWAEMDQFKSIDYNKISTNEVNKWITDLYYLTPIIKNELVNQVLPSPSAIVGVKKLFIQMLQYPHLPDFDIKTNGPEKSIYLNVLKQTGIHRLDGNKHCILDPNKDERLLHLWGKWDQVIRKTKDDNDRLNLLDMIDIARKRPYGIKYGLAHLLAMIKVFSELDQISIYHKKYLGNEFRYIAQIATDTIELLTKKPENFEIKFVDSKIHQSLFSELYHFLNEEQKDITTLLDVARSIIEKVSSLRDRTIKTRKISDRAQKFIKDARDARSPEDLIYIKIPNSLGLKTINSNNKVSNEDYIRKLQEVLNEIQEFEHNIIPLIKQQIIGIWELGIKGNSQISEVKRSLGKKINENVIHWVFDEKLKEFIKRCLEPERNGGAWIESVASHLVGKLPERWSDDDDIILVDQLRFMRIQYEEGLYFYEKNALSNKIDSKDTAAIESEISTLIDKLDATEEEKRVAIINLYEKYVRAKERY